MDWVPPPPRRLSRRNRRVAVGGTLLFVAMLASTPALGWALWEELTTDARLGALWRDGQAVEALVLERGFDDGVASGPPVLKLQWQHAGTTYVKQVAVPDRDVWMSWPPGSTVPARLDVKDPMVLSLPWQQGWDEWFFASVVVLGGMVGFMALVALFFLRMVWRRTQALRLGTPVDVTLGERMRWFPQFQRARYTVNGEQRETWVELAPQIPTEPAWQDVFVVRSPGDVPVHLCPDDVVFPSSAVKDAHALALVLKGWAQAAGKGTPLADLVVPLGDVSDENEAEQVLLRANGLMEGTRAVDPWLERWTRQVVLGWRPDGAALQRRLPVLRSLRRHVVMRLALLWSFVLTLAVHGGLRLALDQAFTPGDVLPFFVAVLLVAVWLLG